MYSCNLQNHIVALDALSNLNVSSTANSSWWATNKLDAITDFTVLDESSQPSELGNGKESLPAELSIILTEINECKSIWQ